MIRYKFSKEVNEEFTTTLNRRVNSYFVDNNISKNANSQMVTKSVVAISMFVVPYIVMMLFPISNLVVLFALWAIMGFGKAFIGTSVMHDSIHGSYSKNQKINWWMSISCGLIGADPTVWRIQHNVLHHSYTNIEDADEDIQPRYVMRFSPNQPRRWFHAYQYIYGLFFYAISTFVWIMYKDYPKIFGYKKRGLIKGKEFRNAIWMMVLRKSAYYIAFLVVPLIVFPFPFWITFLMYLTMHVVTGTVLSLVFQSAHVNPNAKFIQQEGETIEHNWAVHQLFTTTNFGINSKLLSWFIGGLNFQIEHHLFPNICHVHYPKLSKIVRETTLEYDLPYYAEKTFGSAVVSHLKMLKSLGRA